MSYANYKLKTNYKKIKHFLKATDLDFFYCNSKCITFECKKKKLI